MLCSGCGKDIPFVGEVCPHCQRDKGNDQVTQMAGTAGLIFGGFIGWMLFGFMGAILTGIILAAILMGMVMSGSKSQPPKVKIEGRVGERENSVMASSAFSDGAQSDPSNNRSVRERLQEVDDLMSAGLINAEEHGLKRKAILDSI